MPEQETLERAKRDAEEGKSPSTQAGEFVREEMDHIREGKHGAASPQQAVAIGLSKARRAGIKLPPPKRGSSKKVREQAARDTVKGSSGKTTTSQSRSRGSMKGLKKQGSSAASHAELSRFAKSAARRRGAAGRQRAAKAAAKTRSHTRSRRGGKNGTRTRTGRRS
jgi:Family of unknown function (DUF6496)